MNNKFAVVNGKSPLLDVMVEKILKNSTALNTMTNLLCSLVKARKPIDNAKCTIFWMNLCVEWSICCSSSNFCSLRSTQTHHALIFRGSTNTNTNANLVGEWDAEHSIWCIIYLLVVINKQTPDTNIRRFNEQKQTCMRSTTVLTARSIYLARFLSLSLTHAQKYSSTTVG